MGLGVMFSNVVGLEGWLKDAWRFSWLYSLVVRFWVYCTGPIQGRR